MLTYRSKTLIFPETNEGETDIFEGNVMRQIVGSVKENNI